MTATASLAPTTLDACALPPRERHQTILAAFDALAPAASLILRVDHEPRPLLYLFQAERKGLFEWSPIEEGPENWRVEVTKRGAAVGARREVNESLAWDHDRLDGLLEAALLARHRGDLPAAVERIREFALGLNRHIGFEETILFPAFEERTGLPAMAGPTAVMRMEHVEIRQILAELVSAMGDPARDADMLRARLEAVLGQHNMKEEHILYPGTDQVLSVEERDELVGRIQQYRG